jgi:TRAP transporter 4TM/12TM fusion protein
VKPDSKRAVDSELPPKEGPKVHLTTGWKQVAYGVAFAYSIFHVYTAGYELFPNLIQRAIHVGFSLVLVFLLFPIRKRRREKYRPSVFNLILAALSILATVFSVIEYDRIITTIAGHTLGDLIFGSITVILAIEASRRTLGPILPIIVCTILVYALVGSYIPGKWGHQGFSFTYLIERLYMTTEGMFGTITGISATLLAMFVIFSSLLLSTGGAKAFMDIALLVAGRLPGGAAQVATIASGMFGTISGSIIANIATTGSFTIPTMKRLGYSPAFAAAVEATASTGGQIMPPIMGAAAFIMAELLGIAYIKIAIAAFVPALLYYWGIIFSIHLQARQSGMAAVPRELIPSARTVLRWSNSAPVLLPLSVLVFFLFWGFTPMRAAFYATVTSLIIYLTSSPNKKAIRNRLKSIFMGLREGGQALVMVAPLIAIAQIIISLVNLTGVGVKISETIMSVSAGSVPLALVISMIVCMVLGMGIPTTGAYLLTAAVVGPALVLLKLLPLQAHLFLFYYAIFGALTPPVCIAVYVASGIANSDWVKTAWIAVRLGLAGLIVPFIIIYQPALLLIGDPLRVALAVLTALIGVMALGASAMGFYMIKFSIPTRILLAGSAILLIVPGIYTDIPGIIGVIAIYLWLRLRLNKSRMMVAK